MLNRNDSKRFNYVITFVIKQIKNIRMIKNNNNPALALEVLRILCLQTGQ